MKLIKWLAIWMGVGLGILAFASSAVAPGFAAYWAKPVLVVFLVLGLLFGISGQIRAGKEKRAIAYEMERMAGSHDRRSEWAQDAQRRARQIWNKCQDNERLGVDNPVFQPEYRADALLDRMTEVLAEAEILQSDLRAVVRTMEEEGGAE